MPLSSGAMNVLEEAKALGAGTELVFQGLRGRRLGDAKLSLLGAGGAGSTGRMRWQLCVSTCGWCLRLPDFELGSRTLPGISPSWGYLRTQPGRSPVGLILRRWPNGLECVEYHRNALISNGIPAFAKSRAKKAAASP